MKDAPQGRIVILLKEVGFVPDSQVKSLGNFVPWCWLDHGGLEEWCRKDLEKNNSSHTCCPMVNISTSAVQSRLVKERTPALEAYI